MKVNYKSDFDFILTIKDCQGNDIGFPKFDWEAKFYSSQTKIIVYTVSFKDGVFTNCFNDEGKIHCVFDNHRLSAGKLCMEFKAYTPNVIYPDKTKDIYTPMSTGIELVCGAGDCGSTASVEVVASFVYLTAYELAVKNGYEGTLEEYTEYVNKFPQVVETSEAMANMVSDWEKGKEKIAEALTKQGKPTSVAEPMEDMAQKVLDLHLAVEGDPQFVSHLQKLGKWDLFNEMYNHQRAEFPYMYAISFGINKVTLADADAYYCSDGFYTTEGGEYTFNTIGVKYVIFYFRNEDYVLKTQIAKTMYDICIVGGRPMMQVLSKKINTINVYGDNPLVTTVETQRFENLTIQNISFENLTVSGGNVANSCGNLTELSLPMLATVSGGNVANNCNNLTELSLPMLEMFTNQNAESAILRDSRNAKSDIHVYAKNLNYANAYVFRNISLNIKAYIHLGAVRGGYFILNIHPDTRKSARVTVDNGFMSYLNISSFTSMETEMLRDIINNLGDNTDGEPISIIFGATNLAKLTDEDIAIATAKNYSLS